MSEFSDFQKSAAAELAGYGDVLGRVPIDLSGNPINRAAIPQLAKGLMISWMADNNQSATGNIKIYLGEAGSIPWGALVAPTVATTAMAILTGPLSGVTQHGVYITIVPQVTSTGIILLEFTSGSLKRSYTA
jgi:hypothetical protein